MALTAGPSAWPRRSGRFGDVQALFQTLHPANLTNTNGNSRGDVMPIRAPIWTVIPPTFSLQDDGLSVRMSDNGVPFDPLAAPPPDTSTNLEDRPIGGLGLELIRTLPDEIDYARQEGRNVVTAVFYLSPTEAVS